MAGGARLYEANITWTGNRGQGTSAYDGRDHVLRAAGKPDLPMSADQEFLGDPARHNPEDLLVVAISSCRMLWYLHLCANAGIIVRAYEDRPIGRLIESRESGGHFESVLLQPTVTIESGDVKEALRLHNDAHKKCFIANSVNFPVLLEPAIQHASNA
jgi:organic hydroperoxide reductase OsmC/OhrA